MKSRSARRVVVLTKLVAQLNAKFPALHFSVVDKDLFVQAATGGVSSAQATTPLTATVAVDALQATDALPLALPTAQPVMADMAASSFEVTPVGPEPTQPAQCQLEPL